MRAWRFRRLAISAALVAAGVGCASDEENRESRASMEGEAAHGAAGLVEHAQPTASFRDHHAEMLEHLGHIDEMTLSLAGQPAAEQGTTMRQIVRFLKEDIATHAGEEERVLYPVVARAAGEPTRLTDVPVFEHRVVERWIAGLEAESLKARPDTRAFTRDALHLVGLLRAHFEMEEEVLLAQIDETMSTEQFEREVGRRMH